MKRLMVLGGLAAAGALAFVLADKLSRDAIGMAFGMFFGMCAGIPAALLVMAANRAAAPQPEPRPARPAPWPAVPQMPVILVTGQGMAGQPALNAPAQWNLAELQAQGYGQPQRPARHFHVVGEADNGVDEW